MIGITVNRSTFPLVKAITNERYHLSPNYSEAIMEAGANCCLLPFAPTTQIPSLIAELDGLVLSGGNDLDPILYQAENQGSLDICRERDQFEMALCQEALKQGKPILGICRGMQLLNVLLGGTLIQEVHRQTKQRHLQKAAPEIATHTVELVPGSVLAQIFQTDSIQVNSYHHQAIQKLGKDLRATAFSEDGLIEGIEYTNAACVLGVQWHPEMMVEANIQMARLFDYFVMQTQTTKASSL